MRDNRQTLRLAAFLFIPHSLHHFIILDIDRQAPAVSLYPHKCISGYVFSDIAANVISLGFEPRTHSLEGCCSNPTELRNLNSGAKIQNLNDKIKYNH